ncbi:hypothetical protein HanIR_Chr12g0575811 [Helianthus annuus]|nr:hypothetical protein HanIR_Chr12g0575811 [Helianthus annuus]
MIMTLMGCPHVTLRIFDFVRHITFMTSTSLNIDKKSMSWSLQCKVTKVI